MFEYAFVHHAATCTRGRLDGEGHQAVVREQARLGWRLVQVLWRAGSHVTDYVLIFERPAQAPSSGA